LFHSQGHDMIDSRRGGIRDAMPEGCLLRRGLLRIHASNLG
jgi:hypothetical protein